MPDVDLISNVYHYYYTALALQRCDHLQQYITGPCAMDGEAWMGRMGGPFARLWNERRLQDIPSSKVKRLWLHEMVQKGLHRVGGGAELANLTCADIFARRAAQLVRDCDVLHFVQSVGWIAAAKMKRRGAKVICDMREEHPQFQEDILSEEADRLGLGYALPGSSYRNRVLEEIGLADYIFCPSSYAKRTFVTRGIREDRLVVCPYGVDAAQFTPAARGSPRSEFRVLFLGRVCMRKGVHYLLEGFRRAGLSDARLILAGPVDPAYRVVLDRFSGLFEELGSVAHSEVQEQYFNSDVFVMPSLADSYGLVVSEAMAAGLPVIVSENTGMSDFITDGREGYIVPIRDSDKIAERLTFLHANRDRGAAMGAAGAATARALDWNNYRMICGKFYETLFAARSRRRGRDPVNSAS
jgi:glycosyltransferase involved in cell wall biosynthesis